MTRFYVDDDVPRPGDWAARLDPRRGESQVATPCASTDLRPAGPSVCPVLIPNGLSHAEALACARMFLRLALLTGHTAGVRALVGRALADVTKAQEAGDGARDDGAVP